jgi:hypothetical protein
MSWIALACGNYSISDAGEVMSHRAGKVLKPNMVRGYETVQLTDRKRYTVHRLVAQAFIGPRPAGMHINHKNGIKTDNRAENLEYVTPSQNMKHAHAMGLQSNKGEKHSRHKLKEQDIMEIKRRIGRGEMQKDIARDFGVDPSLVSHVKRGRSWPHLMGSAL